MIVVEVAAAVVVALDVDAVADSVEDGAADFAAVATDAAVVEAAAVDASDFDVVAAVIVSVVIPCAANESSSSLSAVRSMVEDSIGCLGRLTFLPSCSSLVRTVSNLNLHFLVSFIGSIGLFRAEERGRISFGVFSGVFFVDNAQELCFLKFEKIYISILSTPNVGHIDLHSNSNIVI